jgi:hypothetical protein
MNCLGFRSCPLMTTFELQTIEWMPRFTKASFKTGKNHMHGSRPFPFSVTIKRLTWWTKDLWMSPPSHATTDIKPGSNQALHGRKIQTKNLGRRHRAVPTSRSMWSQRPILSVCVQLLVFSIPRWASFSRTRSYQAWNWLAMNEALILRHDADRHGQQHMTDFFTSCTDASLSCPPLVNLMPLECFLSFVVLQCLTHLWARRVLVVFATISKITMVTRVAVVEDGIFWVILFYNWEQFIGLLFRAKNSETKYVLSPELQKSMNENSKSWTLS